MAKKRKGGSRRRSRKGAGKKTTPRRRSRKSRRKIYGPKMSAVYLGGALLIGEVIADVVLPSLGVDAPDFLSTDASAFWAYGWWYANEQVQQVAYAVELKHLSDEYDVTDAVKDKLADLLGVGGPELAEGEGEEESPAISEGENVEQGAEEETVQ